MAKIKVLDINGNWVWLDTTTNQTTSITPLTGTIQVNATRSVGGDKNTKRGRTLIAHNLVLNYNNRQTKVHNYGDLTRRLKLKQLTVSVDNTGEPIINLTDYNPGVEAPMKPYTPLEEFYVGAKVLDLPFKFGSKAVQYGLGRYGSRFGWDEALLSARNKILSDVFDRQSLKLITPLTGTLLYLTLKFAPVTTPNEEGALTFFLRKPSKISIAERAGVPKGERNLIFKESEIKLLIPKYNKFADFYGYKQVPDGVSKKDAIQIIKSGLKLHNTFYRGLTPTEDKSLEQLVKEGSWNPRNTYFAPDERAGNYAHFGDVGEFTRKYTLGKNPRTWIEDADFTFDTTPATELAPKGKVNYPWFNKNTIEAAPPGEVRIHPDDYVFERWLPKTKWEYGEYVAPSEFKGSKNLVFNKELGLIKPSFTPKVLKGFNYNDLPQEKYIYNLKTGDFDVIAPRKEWIKKGENELVPDYFISPEEEQRLIASGLSPEEAAEIMQTRFTNSINAKPGIFRNLGKNTYGESRVSEGYAQPVYNSRKGVKASLNDAKTTLNTVFHELGGHGSSLNGELTSFKLDNPLVKIMMHNEGLRPLLKPFYQAVKNGDFKLAEKLAPKDGSLKGAAGTYDFKELLKFIKYMEENLEYSARAIGTNMSNHYGMPNGWNEQLLREYFTEESVNNLLKNVWNYGLPTTIGTALYNKSK